MAFLAFQPSLEQRELLGKTIDDLQQRFSGLSWEHWQDLHITVKFIAGWNRQDLARITEVWQEALDQTAAFNLCLTGYGTFNRRGKPEVLWLGVADSTELSRLADRLDLFLAEHFGIPQSEKPFRPHLTLARVANPAAFCAQDWYALERTPMYFPADEMRLMKRRSGGKRPSSGPLYEVLATTRLPISRT